MVELDKRVSFRAATDPSQGQEARRKCSISRTTMDRDEYAAVRKVAKDGSSTEGKATERRRSFLERLGEKVGRASKDEQPKDR